MMVILESIDRIKKYTEQGKSAFFESTIIQDAVIRNFEKMSDAAGKISDHFAAEHSRIPWRQLSLMQNLLLYPDLELVWNTIEKNLETIRCEIERIPPGEANEAIE